MHAWELVANIVQDLNLISRLALLPKFNGGAEYGMSDNSESVFSSARHILEPLLTTKSEINPFHVSSTHQTSYGYFNAGIEIHMVNGTSRTLQHKLVFKAGGFRCAFRSPFRVSSSTERAVPVTPNVWPICKFVTATNFHKFEFVTEFVSLVFFSFLAKQVWSYFGHKCHKWSHFQLWLVQTCFCFYFDWNGSE